MLNNEERNARVVISADSSQYTSGVQQATAQTQQLDKSVNALNKSMDGLMARAGKKLVLFAAADMAALTGATMIAATLEKQMSSLEATAKNMNGSFSMANVRNEIRSISREIPMARGEIAQLATSITKLGITTSAQVGGMTRAFANLGGATGESPFALAQGQIGLSRQMGTLVGGTSAISNINDSLTTLSARGGVPASSILGFAQNIAPSARMAGMSQQDVLGVSTAFNRAGADGGYAANVFNQIINDITRMRAMGSPEINRYGAVLGMNRKQINDASPLEIFNQLIQGSMGEQGARMGDLLGFDGVRTQKALQAMSAEGGLPKWIAESRAAYGSGSTEKGAEAAFSGFFDSVEKLKNNFTDIGQAIGEEFLPVASKFTEGLATFTEKLVSSAQPLIKAFGLLAAPVGVAAAALGTLAQFAGPVAMALTARRVASSAWFTSAKAGLTDPNKLDPGLRHTLEDKSVMPGAQGKLYRGTYQLTSMFRNFGMAAPENLRSLPSNLLRYGSMGLGVGSRWMMNVMADDYNKSTLRTGMERYNAAFGDRRGFFSSFMGGLRRGTGEFTAADSPGAVNARSTQASVASIKETWNMAKANAAGASTARVVAKELGGLGAQAGRLGIAFTRASASLVGAAMGTGLNLAGQGAMKGANGLAGLMGKAGSGLMSLAGGPAGLAMLGGVAAYGIYQGSNEYNDRSTEDRDASVYNGIVAYDAALGKSSDRVLTFTKAIDDATSSLAAQKGSREAALTAPDLAQRAAGKQDYTNAQVGNLKKEDAVSWMMSQGNLGPEQANLMAEDLYKKFGGDASGIISQYMQLTGGGKNVDPSKLGFYLGNNSEAGGGMAGFFGSFASELAGPSGVGINSLPVIGDISNAITGWGKNQFLNPDVVASTGVAVNNILAQQRDAQEFMTTSNPAYRDKYAYALTGKNLEKAFLQTMGDTSTTSAADQAEVRTQELINQLSSAGMVIDKEAIKNIDMTGMDDAGKLALIQDTILKGTGYSNADLGANREDILADGSRRKMSKTTEATVDNLSAVSKSLGQFADAFSKNKKIQEFLKDPGNPNAIASGAEMLKNMAMQQNGGNISSAQSYLRILADDNPFYADMANAANEALSGDKERLISTLNRTSQAKVVNQDIDAAFNDAKANTANQGEILSSAKSSAKDYITSLYVATRDYQRNRERQDEDYYKGLARQDEDYYRQREYSVEDYNRQMRQSEFDFQLQTKYSKQDFYRQMRQSDEDYYRGLTRMAEDAAKGIYDPFARVQAQSVTSASGLITNLRDQNQRINQQTNNLDQLRAMGISQEAIDMLGLGDVNKAQQVEYMLNAGISKGQINKINSSVSNRQDATSGLVMDERNNQALRRQGEDRDIQIRRGYKNFERGLERSEDAFERSVRRSNANFNRSLVRSDQAYHRSLERMQEDRLIMLARAKEDFLGFAEDTKKGYKEMVSSTTDMLNSLFGKAADKLNAHVKDMHEKLKELRHETLHLTDPEKTPTAKGGREGYTRGYYNGENDYDPNSTQSSTGKRAHQAWTKGGSPFASGGIVTKPTNALIGEAGYAEAVIPLNTHGMDFLGKAIKKQFVANRGMSPFDAQQAMSVYNSTTNFNGEIKIEAQDPGEMARKLKERQRLLSLRQGNRKP